MMGGFAMFTMMFWMVVGTLLFIVLATVVIWFLVRWLNRQKAPGTNDALHTATGFL